MYKSFNKEYAVTFLKIIYEARNHQAAGPRDKVFALLAHLSAQKNLQEKTIAQADYTKSTLEVYQELAEAFLRAPRHHLELLSAVEHLPRVDFDQLNGFPSWVPRWDLGGQSTVLGEPEFGHFKTALNKEPKVTILGSDGVIRIEGILFDHVARYSGPIDINDFLDPQRALVNRLWESYGSTDFSTAYTTGELLVEAFHRTLSSDGRTYAYSDEHEYVSTYRLKNHQNFIRYWSNRSEKPETPDLPESEQEKRRYFTSIEAIDDGNEEDFQKAAQIVCHGRKFFVTKKGYFGVGPLCMKENDLVCVLYGGQVPFLL